MTTVEIARLLALGVVFLYGLSVIGSGFGLRPYRKSLFWLSVLGVVWLVLGESALRGWQQYLAWSGDEKTAGLLTKSPRFIYFYSFGRFALWRWIGAVAAAIIYWLSMRFIVKPSDGFKLNRNEALLIAFGIALAGWPGLVLYLLALLILYVAILAPIQLRATTSKAGTDPANFAEPRFAVALPATLALITIPFIQQLLVWASNTLQINLLFYNVTNLSI